MRAHRLLLPVLLIAAPSHAATGTVHPGVRTTTGATECTSNFVFHDASGALYLGQAARCSAVSPGTDGCTAAVRPLGTKVVIEGASREGVLAYSSWNAMQAAVETDPFLCEANDFALVRLDPADYSRVDPTMPFWGGPTGTASAARPGDRAFTYGNNATGQPQPRTGIVIGTGGAWSYRVLFVPPAEAGMGVLDGTGRALGIVNGLDVIALAPVLAYAQSHGGPAVSLTLGTEPFDPRP